MEQELKRIADALEEVIRMVKKDQQETKERFEKRWDKEEPKPDLPDDVPFAGRL